MSNEPQALALLPCPFCGSSSVGESYLRAGDIIIQCRNCSCMTSDCDTVEIAARHWNTRIPLPPAEADRDDLARAIVSAAKSVGITDGEMDLTGPQLILLCDDLAKASHQPPAESAVIEAAKAEYEMRSTYYLQGPSTRESFGEKWEQSSQALNGAVKALLAMEGKGK